MTVLNRELLLASDETIAGFLRTLYEDQLNDMLAYHLSDEAAGCLLANMSERARALVNENVVYIRSLLRESESRFFEAKDQFAHAKVQYPFMLVDTADTSDTASAASAGGNDRNARTALEAEIGAVCKKNYCRYVKTAGGAVAAVFSDGFDCLKACVETRDECAADAPSLRAALHCGELAFNEAEHGAVAIRGDALDTADAIRRRLNAGEMVCSKEFVDRYAADAERRKRQWLGYRSNSKAASNTPPDGCVEETDQYAVYCDANLAFCGKVGFLPVAADCSGGRALFRIAVG